MTRSLPTTARRGVFFSLPLVLVLLFANGLFAQSPNISGVSPSSVWPGGQITITGTNFGSAQGSTWVANYINNWYFTVTSWSDTQVVATVPANAQTGNVYLDTHAGAQSNPFGLTVYMPSISTISPDTVSPGGQITITGTNLGSSPGYGWVGNSNNDWYFTITSWSDTQVVGTVPVNAQTGLVYLVTQAGAQSNPYGLTVNTPNLAGVSPTTVSPGGQITLNGTNFGSSPGYAWVGNYNNNWYFTITGWSDTQIRGTVPVNAQTGLVYLVTQAGAQSNPYGLTVNAPNLVSVSPTTVSPGGQITLNGTNFGSAPGAAVVGNYFNNWYFTITNWSDTQVAATVPFNAQSGLVYLYTQAGAQSNPYGLTVLAPAITGVSPNPVLPAGQITVSGSNFGSTQGGVGLYDNAGWVNCTVGTWSDTTVVATIPASATSGTLYITTQPGAQTNAGLTVNAPTLTGVSPAGVLPGGQITITGNYFGSTAGAVTCGDNWGWHSCPVVSWSASSVVATVPVSVQSGPVYITTQAGAASNYGTDVVLTPSVTGISPTAAPPGGQVTLTGGNFGSTPGAVTLADIWGWFNCTVVSWSNSTVVANLPTSSVASGTIFLTTPVGAQSNQIGLTIATPPGISATLSPTPNSSGWNDTPVTVSFTCTAGTFAVATCPGPQTVSSEGASQAVTGTVTDTQGIQASVTVSVNLDMTPPVIAVSAPADMSTVSQAGVTITGTATDALSGTTQVTCGGVTATLASSAFTCNVTLNVGLSLTVIKATDAAGNVSASKLHLDLAGALPAPSTLTVTPSGVNMLVGGTQQFTAVDQLGEVRTDATWTVSDNTIATITSDSSPLMTAVATGTVTLTATVGSVTGQTTVNVLSGTSLPSGTLLWSAPPPTGATVQGILQAVPSTGSPDLYTVATSGGACLITGLTGGGQQVWTGQVAVTSSFGCKGVPDGSGGLLVETGGEIVGSGFATHITDVDGQTGSQVWRTDINGPSSPPTLSVGADGTVYYSGWLNPTNLGLVALAADTGIPRLLYTPPQTVNTFNPSCEPIPDGPGVTNLTDPIIGPDGSVFAGLMVGSYNEGNGGCRPPIPSQSQQTLYLVQVAPSGMPTLTQFKADTNVYNVWPNYTIFSTIPDGQGGALVGWSFSTGGPNSQGHVTDVSSSGATDFSVPGQPYQMVLGMNGLAFVASGGTVTALNLTNGTPSWNYPNPHLASIVAATGDGGLIVNDSVQGLITLDANGSPGPATPAPANAQPWTSGYWLGVYDTLPGMSGGPLASIAMNAWPILNGNRAGSRSSPHLTIATFIPFPPSTVAPFDNTQTTANYLKANIPVKAASQRYYVNPNDGSPIAGTTNFFLENGNPVDVIGFIGHSLVIGNDTSDPTGFLSVGLEFTDAYLVRGPDCSPAGHAASHCYWNEAEVISTPINAATALQVQGGWIQVQAPCAPEANAFIGSDGNAWCIRVPTPFQPPITLWPGVITSARVVFTSACDTTDWYSSWWIWSLFQSQIPPSGALVMPDVAAMMTLPANTSQGFPPRAYGNVDLGQGVDAYQAFVNSLALGEDVDTAVQNVNTRLALDYPLLTVPPGLQKLPQLVFMKVGGGTDVCPVCLR